MMSFGNHYVRLLTVKHCEIYISGSAFKADAVKFTVAYLKEVRKTIEIRNDQ